MAAIVAMTAAIGPGLTTGAGASGSVVRAVPPATGNNAVITVKVGGDRTGASAVSELAGVVLGFFDTTTSPTPAFTCTSDADGDCSITVPNTDVLGANHNRRFFVEQVSAPAGWFTNPTMRTGQSTAAESQATPYQFQTGTQLSAGTTYRSTADFMEGSGDGNRVASGGVWQAVASTRRSGDLRS